MTDRLGLAPAVRAFFDRAQRGDPQRKRIALVATPHDLVRVMWAILKRGAVWEEKLALARVPSLAYPK
jgi:hypothetical protein